MALSYDSERNVVVAVVGFVVILLFGHILTGIGAALRLGSGLLRRKELHIIHDDVGLVVGLTVVVDPLVVLQMRFDEHLAALPTVLADVLGNLPESRDTMPIGLGDPLVTILLATRRSESNVADLQPVLRNTHLGISTKVSSENDTVSHNRLLC